MVFDSVRRYFWDRRRTIITTAGAVGGTWLLAKYLMGRLEEMRDKVMHDRNAREKYVASIRLLMCLALLLMAFDTNSHT